MSIDVLTDGVVAPTRAADRAQILALIAEHPESQIQALATLSELPNAYVLQIMRYLDLYGQSSDHGGAGNRR